MAFSAMHLFYEDLEVGQEFRSSGRTVTETDIVNFAGLSGDFNPIHTDHEFAKKTPFRRPIAHGLLVFSIASGLQANNPSMRTIAFLKVRELIFHNPVFIGDTVTLTSKVVEILPRSRGRRAEVIWYRTLHNQHGKLVQETFIHTLVEGRALKRNDSETPAED